VATARLLKSSVLEFASFVPLEMPAYRWPTVQSLGLRLLTAPGVSPRRNRDPVVMVIRVAQHSLIPAANPGDWQLAGGTVGHLLSR
jgi:hypothetical protein